jgi:Cu2+-exporting ATPase
MSHSPTQHHRPDHVHESDHVPRRTPHQADHHESMAHDDLESDAIFEGHQDAESHGGHDMHEGHTGHGGHEGHADLFRTRFWVTALLTIPIVLYSEMVQHWLRFSMPEFPGSEWIAPVLGTVVFFYGGTVFLKGGRDELRQRQPGMMLLISLAIVVAFAASLATTFGWLDMEFWWELALLITIMLLGHWQEMRALGETRNALQSLAELVPDEAERIVDGQTEIVAINELRHGDLVLVRPGGRVPADGMIQEGRADIDESMITGESRPVERGEGDRVVAGTVVAGSSVRFRVDATGDQTALAGIQRMVEEAQTSRSRAQALADRFAAALFYIAVAAGVITFAVWWALGDIDQALSRTVTVLVISCPHALGLAIPLVVAISTESAARAGSLVKDRLALERMRTIDTVLFDKTGTLTRGEHVLTGIVALNGDEESLLVQVAAVEMDSEHPLAKAIVTAAQEKGLRIPVVHDFAALPGRGVQATVDGLLVSIGGPSLLEERGIQVPETFRVQTAAWSERGAAVLHVIRGNDIVGALALEDEIRAESRQAVRDLQANDVRVVMITGDARPVAESVGRELGIDEVFAEVLPGEKQDVVKELQGRGERVAMVGDGVNDAPALAQADVGIAIGAGTDVAIQSAGVVLASSDPRLVSGVRRLSTASYRKMIQNLAWAGGYNVAAIPLAAGVLAPVGFTLSPAVGAVLMSLSTIIVALNAQLLRRIDIRPGAGDTREA